MIRNYNDSSDPRNQHSGNSPMLSHFSLKSDTDSADAVKRAYASPNARRSLFEYTNAGEMKSKSREGHVFSNSPLSGASQKLLKSPKKPQRKIPKMPFKDLCKFFALFINRSSSRIRNLFKTSSHGPRRARTSRRLLSQSSRLGPQQFFGSWPRKLRLPLERGQF